MSAKVINHTKIQNKELHVKILKAYLTPLLEKHNRGESIVYEDLIESRKKADHILLHQPTSSSLNQGNNHKNDVFKVTNTFILFFLEFFLFEI